MASSARSAAPRSKLNLYTLNFCEQTQQTEQANAKVDEDKLGFIDEHPH